MAISRAATKPLILGLALFFLCLGCADSALAFFPAPVLKTGQDSCYDATGGVIDCAGTGQDGELQNGLAWPNARFVDNGDQTVTDSLTGLIWTKDANLMQTRDRSFDADSNYNYAPDGKVTWQHALDYIKKLNAENYLGHNDWRLPNVEEMKSLNHAGLTNLALWLNGRGFSNVQHDYQYWSSSTWPRFSTGAWAVSLYDGFTAGLSKKDNALYLWPIRNAQTGSAGSLALRKTGQSACFDTAGAAIACPGTGQDGELQKGVSWPTARFTDNPDQSVTDQLTGLIWSKNGNLAAPMTWQGALDYLKSLNAGNYLGHNDWRLPQRDELLSLANLGQVEDFNNWAQVQSRDSFNQPNWYWSSTSYAGSSSRAWFFIMNGSYQGIDLKTASHSIWPVRGDRFWSVDAFLIAASPRFPATRVGTCALPRQIEIGNRGSSLKSVDSLAVSGADASEFSLSTGGSNPCASLAPSLSAGASCTLMLGFSPASNGNKSASLDMTANGEAEIVAFSAAALATIYGTVTDQSTGLPVPGATVTLGSSATVTSGADGSYTFGDLPAASYSISIAKNGYQSISTGGLATTATSSARMDILLPTLGILNISSTLLPSATAGEAYSSRVMVSGGTAPYAFSKPSGNLPPGLSLDSASGAITGTPSGTGSYSFAIGVTDSVTGYSEREYSIDLVPTLQITTTTLPFTSFPDPNYNASLKATGGKGALSFALVSGSLPYSLVLDATGTISTYTAAGMPLPPPPGTMLTGNFDFSVQVTDSTGRVTQNTFVMNSAAALALSGTLNTGRVNSPYSSSLTASGGYAALTWSVAGGTLPAGFTLSPATGVISGQPAGTGSYPLKITVTDSVGRAVTKSFTLNVSAPLAVTSSTLPAGYLSSPYSQNIQTTGGTAPLGFSFSGSLPAGLLLEAATGVISGTPSAAGFSNLGVTVTDSSNPPVSVTATVSLRIWSALSITTSAIAGGTQKVAFSSTLNGVGGAQPLSWSIASGALPGAVSLDPVTGTLSGTPGDCGTFNFTARLTDSAALPKSVDKPLALSIACAPINASCGAADSAVFATAPTTNLCSAGIASTMTGAGPWQWSCAGEYGGTAASCSALPGVPLSLSFAGNGAGSVSGALTCTSGSACASQAFVAGAKLDLLASPNAISTFSGWSGACSGGAGNCSITMDGAKSIMVSFTKAPKAKIGAAGYDSLAAACASAASGATILALDSDTTDLGLTLNLGKTITIKGGYEADYNSRSAILTSLQGPLKLTNGKLTVDGLAVK